MYLYMIYGRGKDDLSKISLNINPVLYMEKSYNLLGFIYPNEWSKYQVYMIDNSTCVPHYKICSVETPLEKIFSDISIGNSFEEIHIIELIKVNEGKNQQLPITHEDMKKMRASIRKFFFRKEEPELRSFFYRLLGLNIGGLLRGVDKLSDCLSSLLLTIQLSNQVYESYRLRINYSTVSSRDNILSHLERKGLSSLENNILADDLPSCMDKVREGMLELFKAFERLFREDSIFAKAFILKLSTPNSSVFPDNAYLLGLLYRLYKEMFSLDLSISQPHDLSISQPLKKEISQPLKKEISQVLNKYNKLGVVHRDVDREGNRNLVVGKYVENIERLSNIVNSLVKHFDNSETSILNLEDLITAVSIINPGKINSPTKKGTCNVILRYRGEREMIPISDNKRVFIPTNVKEEDIKFMTKAELKELLFIIDKSPGYQELKVSITRLLLSKC